MSIKRLYDEYKDIIFYGIFGILTTLINIVAYWIVAHLIGLSTTISTWIAWIAAVFFAYVTNRKWVFHSKALIGAEMMKEMVSFFLCRLATGVVDWGCMFILVELLHWNDVVTKTLSNLVVIFLNYVGSKQVVFRNRKTD